MTSRERRAGAAGALHGRIGLLALALSAALALVLIVTAVALDLAGDGATVLPSDRSATPREDGIGACLALAGGTADEAMLIRALERSAAARPYLLPDATYEASTVAGEPGRSRIAAWPSGASEADLARFRAGDDIGPCAEPTEGWAFTVTDDLLADGADRLLAAAEFSEEWTAAISVELQPEESRVRTTLRFVGPLAVGGSCWLDETLTLDAASGRPVVRAEAGDDAGIPGLVACGRFHESMPDGGAGALALALLPAEASGADGQPVLRAGSVVVGADRITVTGDLGA